MQLFDRQLTIICDLRHASMSIDCSFEKIKGECSWGSKDTFKCYTKHM